MNKIYQFLDGKIIIAANHNDFFTKLRNGSFHPLNSDIEYMEEFAKRFYIIYGKYLETKNIDSFVESMIIYKLVYIREFN